METPSPQPLQSCLSSSSKLKNILQKAEHLLYINKLLQEALPAGEMRQACRLANWANGCLTVAADSSAWAFRLRFQHQELLKQLQLYLPELKDIRYIILPQEQTRTIKRSAKPTISKTAKGMIQMLSESIEDNKLKEALARLARK